MPWRDTDDPYKILVSEIMLQQTQVSRVLEKYPPFIKRFPTLQKLARAPLGDVLRLWQGLGYNRRAKMLHSFAQQVVDTYHGIIPATYDELVDLPGIGRSTAGAILAFAFEKDVPMIDTNIRRILCRVFFGRKRKMPTDKELYEFGSLLIPRGKGRMWNYALLDIGAMYCTAKHHKDDCPLKHLHGRVKDLTTKTPQKPFHNSRRYWRGLVLRELALHSMSSRQIKDAFHECKDIDAVVRDLLKEKMISMQGRRYALGS